MENKKMEEFKKALFDMAIVAEKDMGLFGELWSMCQDEVSHRNATRAEGRWSALRVLIKRLDLDTDYICYRLDNEG